MFAIVNDTKIETATQKTGITVDLYPRASPMMMFGAAPEVQAFAKF